MLHRVHSLSSRVMTTISHFGQVHKKSEEKYTKSEESTQSQFSSSNFIYIKSDPGGKNHLRIYFFTSEKGRIKFCWPEIWLHLLQVIISKILLLSFSKQISWEGTKFAGAGLFWDTSVVLYIDPLAASLKSIVVWSSKVSLKSSQTKFSFF